MPRENVVNRPPVLRKARGDYRDDLVDVEFNGKLIASVKTAFARAVELADISPDSGKIIPHTLRHTAATWLMQRGVPVWEAAGYLGMSIETLERVYGHHSRDHLKGAADAISRFCGRIRGRQEDPT
jgi:integrase